MSHQAQGKSTQLRYHLRCVEDLHAMLVAQGDWVPLGNADEQKPAAEGCECGPVEAAGDPEGCRGVWSFGPDRRRPDHRDRSVHPPGAARGQPAPGPVETGALFAYPGLWPHR